MVYNAVRRKCIEFSFELIPNVFNGIKFRGYVVQDIGHTVM